MHISAIQTGNYYTKAYSQPLKPQKAQPKVSNASLPKDTVSFSGLFSRSSSEENAILERRKQAACNERFGNTEINRVAPEIIKEAVKRLEDMGFKEIDYSELHIIQEDAPYDTNSPIINIISYYDKSQDASIRFTNDGNLAYMAKYDRTSSGEIVGHYYCKYYDFNTREWHDISSRRSSSLIP